MDEDSPQSRLDRIARRQHGAFSRAQAHTARFTDRMIDRRLATGTWLRLDTRLYALASHPFTWERQAMAATLAVEGSVLSGRAAAALHGIEGFRRARLEITVPRARRATTRLATVRRSDFAQATKVNGIPCLTVAHTVLSLAGRLQPARLDDAVDHVLGRRQVSLAELQDRFAAWAPRRPPGADAVRRILGAKGDAYAPPTSELERLLRGLVRVDGLPDFVFEYELPWWPEGDARVDAYAAVCTTIVEGDGRGWHARERDFVNDRRRDNLAAAHGHATLRFTYVDLLHYAGECRDLIARTAAVRGWSPAASLA